MSKRRKKTTASITYAYLDNTCFKSAKENLPEPDTAELKNNWRRMLVSSSVNKGFEGRSLLYPEASSSKSYYEVRVGLRS